MNSRSLGLSKSSNEALVIIGMHRSGTSAATGALQCLGVSLGRSLYSGHSHINAKGYFEHSDIADANDEALLSVGSAWDDVLPKEEGWWAREELRPFAEKIRRYIRRDFSQSALWAIKDPRVCRMLPWWLEILAEEAVTPHFLFVIRTPDAVFRSLERRDGFSREKSCLLWVLHYLEAEKWSRGYQRAFMEFDRFIDDPSTEMRRIEKMLGVHFPISIQSSGDCLIEFLSKDLRHHEGGSQRQCHSPIVALAYELEHRLHEAAAADAEVEVNTKDISAQLDDIIEQFDPMLVEQLRSLGRQRGRTELTLDRVMRSWSWGIGKPIRLLERLIGRDV